MINYLKNIVRNNGKLSELSWAVRGLWGETPQSIHEKYFRKKTKHIIPNYIANTEEKKLQIGGGNNILKGWLNVNIYCGDRDSNEEFRQAFMDATKTFPFENDTFQYIFSEHMIEHISYRDAEFMLTECFRVMKQGGRIRIATPGFDNLIHLLSENKSELVDQYFEKLICPQYGTDIPRDPSYALNYMCYNYGHKFIHSKVSLTHLLNKAGFCDPEFMEAQKSKDPNLENLEINHIHTGKEINKMETLVVEAVKP